MWVDRYVNLSRWNNHNHLGDGLVSGDFSKSLDALVCLVKCHTIAKNLYSNILVLFQCCSHIYWCCSHIYVRAAATYIENAATYIGAAATYMGAAATYIV